MTETPLPPGWYDDPEQPNMERYWDGQSWSDYATPKQRKAEVYERPTSAAMQRSLHEDAGVPMPRTRSPWGVWWLCLLTFGIWYFIWYHRINKEICAVLGERMPLNAWWWNQLIPFWRYVGLGATAKRLNRAHALMGSPVRVSLVMTWLLAPLWFQSQTRYLQRRINVLGAVMVSRSLGL
jgi:hypothetical protein